MVWIVNNIIIILTSLPYKGGFLICFIFGLPVKFGPSVRSPGTYFLVIRFFVVIWFRSNALDSMKIGFFDFCLF